MSFEAPVVDGEVVVNATPTKKESNTKGTNALGKDAFLQLLVAQMQSQDPLNPDSNTEYVSQLAQFSALEEMQNLNTAMDNGNAYALVGKNVIMEVGKSSGAATTTTVAGYVQFVQMISGKAYLGIDGETYPYEDLDTVIDDTYLDSILQEENKK